MTTAAGILNSLEFQMSILLFVALAGYLVSSKIKQSAVVGQILVGILIGPSLLGLITYTDFVSQLGHLGAVILLFAVGLHFKIKDIMNLKYGIIALVGLVVPWMFGFITAHLFNFGFGGAVFIGTALTATSIAITANVLKEMGKLQTEVAKAIIGAAVIDDVLSLLALSVSEEIVTGSFSVYLTIITVVKAVGFIVIGVIIGQFCARKLFTKIDNSNLAKLHPETVFIFSLMFAFLYAMAAEIIGLSAIIGSFLAGVSFEGVGLVHGKVFREGTEYLQIIFGAIFFVSLGILVELHTLDIDLLIFTLVLTIVAVLTKVIGCGLAAKFQGMNIIDSLIIGFGMSPRGEVAMIVALIGLNKELITQNTYVSLVLMSLITTIITPIVLRRLILRETAEKIR
ncbi:cation:proton antiporter [Candidatus Woesearchaeota archaeon]|nr:cation:proton antiporter [Candidatus Woesearchaeota archaeon]